MTIKSALRGLAPPILWNAMRSLRARAAKARLLRPAAGFSGSYASFREARAASTGYESSSLVEATLNESRAFRQTLLDGHRPEIEFNFLQIFGAMLPVVVRDPKRRIRVLDVGGAMGSLAWSVRRFTAIEYDWTVLETPAMGSAAAEFTEANLRFTADPDAARTHGPFDMVLLSGVLQVLEDPWSALRRFSSMGAYVLVARTPLIAGETDRLTVFTVPETRFGSHQSFPFWFLSEDKWRQAVDAIGTIELTWTNAAEILSLDGTSVPHRGFLIRVKSQSPSAT